MKNFRTGADTQIYKELAGGEVTEEELEMIKTASNGAYKMYRDEANGYTAFSFSDYDQKEDRLFGDLLIFHLKDLNDFWFLGDENEEYVFVN